MTVSENLSHDSAGTRTTRVKDAVAITDTLPASTVARGLPGFAYTSPEIFGVEVDRFFNRNWIYAGHVSQIPTPGAFFRHELAGVDLLIVRGADGVIRALHNTCRHRGSQLIAEDSGECGRSIVCQYHGWSYDQSGELRGAPKMDDAVDKPSLGLKQAEVEIWNGIIFVHALGASERSVAEILDGVELPYEDDERSKVAKVVSWDVPTNWKASYENALECYHCAINHPELLRILDSEDDGSGGDGGIFGDGFVYFDPVLTPGAVTVTMSGQIESAVIYKPASPPRGERGFLQWHTSVFEMVAFPDHSSIQSYKPISPELTRITLTFLVPEAAQEGRDYDPETFFELHIRTREQDNGLCSRIQAGVRNLAYEPGPLNEIYEFENKRFLETYWSVMGDIDELANE